jgi:alpha-tubulin suppressor-like RCC1 family protein
LRRAAARVARLIALALPLVQLGCPGPGDFRCHTRAQCGGSDAVCELDGRCSLADTSCASGRRYREREGDRSGQCVGDACPGNPLGVLVAGADHACALRGDGALTCWGRNDVGQLGDGSRTARSLPVAVGGLPPLRAVAAGARHTCALTRDVGDVYCWGGDEAGQLGQPDNAAGAPRTTPVQVAGVTDALDVAAGSDFSCAVLRDGTARCWGANDAGQLGDGGPKTTRRAPTVVFALSGVRALSASWQHVCALRDDETLWCWGAGSVGQLGDGAARDAPQPVRVVGLDAVTAVATGLQHTCAATRAEGLFCWGANTSSQLGREASPMEARPARVPIVTNPVAVAAGGAHTCAIRRGGATLCWGANGSGQLGNGSTSTLPIPVKVNDLGAATKVVAGSTFTCARGGGDAVFCWGDDRYGQLALGKTTSRPRAAPVPSIAGASDLATGAAHGCAIVGGAAAGDAGAGTPQPVACWGANQAGQLGDGSTMDRSIARPVTGLEATRVSAGVAHSCAIAEGGALWCWGRGGSGQLGRTRAVDTPSPAMVPLAASARVVGAALGDTHTCAALSDGTARCWGANGDGQLGDGTSTAQPLATVAPAVGGATPLAGIEALTAGDGHTCARLADGGVRCWGRGTRGQLGAAATTSSATPVTTPLASPADDVTAGAAHTCAATAGGEVACWGANDDGQLGAPPSAGASSPATVATLDGVRGVAAGGGHTCAVTQARTVVCWGANDDGQLGDGTTKASATPLPVLGLTEVEQLGAGATHTCARRADGGVWCWGDNSAGQLGDDAPLWRGMPQLARLTCH